MKRFTFIGRLGAGDTAAVTIVQRDSVSVTVQFVAAFQRLDYGIGDALDMLWRLGRMPSETAIDFLILAAMVNAADTRVSRSANAQDGWTREIDVIVPVSNVALWIGQTDLIERTLRFLTGDHWRIFFRNRPSGFDHIAKSPTKLPLTNFDEVCLFSGGLDSLIGAIDILDQKQTPILVSHYWDSETSKAQNALLTLLKKKYTASAFKSLRVRLGFDKNHVNTGEIENSLRARSFLFFGLAVLAASAIGGPANVIVPENGLIGLNVPLDPLRLGSLSTRTTHPYYMARVNDLLRAIGLSVTLVNPYRHQTKGEMIKNCRDLSFLRTISEYSMSCSSPAKARYKKLPPQHCGTCVPCLIRRASLQAGLGIADATTYAVPSLIGRTLDTTAAEGEHIRSFQLMIERLCTNAGVAKSLVRIPGPLNDAPSEVDDYIDVFRRGILEVNALLARVRARPI
jgi:7-cyano-7-deazaguanine synthase in queuosine biosynthesis